MSNHDTTNGITVNSMTRLQPNKFVMNPKDNVAIKLPMQDNEPTHEIWWFVNGPDESVDDSELNSTRAVDMKPKTHPWLKIIELAAKSKKKKTMQNQQLESQLMFELRN